MYISSRSSRGRVKSVVGMVVEGGTAVYLFFVSIGLHSGIVCSSIGFLYGDL